MSLYIACNVWYNVNKLVIYRLIPTLCIERYASVSKMGEGGV